MIGASELVFSDAELTLLAFTLDKPYFPAAPPPKLDASGWDAVQRALIARGVINGRFRKRVADDVQAVLDVVLSADRSLWPTIAFAAGQGESIAWVLWCKDDAVVRQRVSLDGMQHLNVSAATAIDEMLTAMFDGLGENGESQPGPMTSMEAGEFASAAGIAVRESVDVAAQRFPLAEEFLVANAASRCSVTLETRVRLGDDVDRVEMISLTQSREHGLWLAHDESRTSDRVTGAQTRLQRVSIEMAREAMTTLAYGSA